MSVTTWPAPCLDLVVSATRWLTAIGVILSSAEWLTLAGEFERRGLYDRRIIALIHRQRIRTTRSDWYLGEGRAMRRLLLARILAGCLVLVPGVPAELPFAALSVTHAYMNFRCVFGPDGADQMLMILTFGLFIDAACGDEGVRLLTVAFIAAQSCLSYFVAGVAKMWGRSWRDGTALAGIASTRRFGRPGLARVLARHPRLGRSISHLVIAYECVFPATVLLPYPTIVVYLAAGVAFHAINAHFMGLNLFALAFPATYPSVLYCSYCLGSLLR